MQLPFPASGATAGMVGGMVMTGIRDVIGQAVASSAGVATVTFDPVDVAEQWLVDHVVVQSTSAATCSARFYDADPTDPRSLLDGTSTGNLDIADYPQGLLIDGGKQLIVVWSAASPGATCTVRAKFRVFEPPAGQ